MDAKRKINRRRKWPVLAPPYINDYTVKGQIHPNEKRKKGRKIAISLLVLYQPGYMSRTHSLANHLNIISQCFKQHKRNLEMNLTDISKSGLCCLE